MMHRIRTPGPNHWQIVLLPAAGRGELRRQLQWLGFGQIEPGVLAHATLTATEARQACAPLPGGEHVLVFTANGLDSRTDRRVATSSWELGTLATRYRRFMAAFEPLRTALDTGPTLEPESAFVVRTLLLHEFRKVHLRDPLLPAPLLAADWAGFAAYGCAAICMPASSNPRRYTWRRTPVGSAGRSHRSIPRRMRVRRARPRGSDDKRPVTHVHPAPELPPDLAHHARVHKAETLVKRDARRVRERDAGQDHVHVTTAKLRQERF